MFHLIEPQLGRISGGLRYNHSVVEAAAGKIQRHELPGAWPQPTRADVQALTDLIHQLDGPVLLDGLIGCSLRHLSAHPCRSSNSCTPWPKLRLLNTVKANCLKAADAVVAHESFRS